MSAANLMLERTGGSVATSPLLGTPKIDQFCVAAGTTSVSDGGSYFSSNEPDRTHSIIAHFIPTTQGNFSDSICDPIRNFSIEQIRNVGTFDPILQVTMWQPSEERVYPVSLGAAFATGEYVASWRKRNLARLQKRLNELASLPNNWAGPGSVSPLNETVKVASEIVAQMPETLDIPQASASGEGEIGLTWYKKADRFSVLLDSDFQLVWTVRIAGRVYPGEHLDLNREKVEHLGPLYSALAKFFQRT